MSDNAAGQGPLERPVRPHRTPTRDEVERLMKRCQIGVGGRNALEDAHSIMAECYGTLGLLMLCIEWGASKYEDMKRLLLGNARRLNSECERMRDALMSIDAIATRCIGEPVATIEDELMRIGTKCRAALGPNA